MKQRILLLSSALALCAGALGVSPAAAAAPSGDTAVWHGSLGPAASGGRADVTVGRVKATPARQSGACPTTVGFSAEIAARKDTVVRYRWVRGDGGKSAIRTVRVRGGRGTVVTDRQTFHESTSGWQAVEVIGRPGLSAKAAFTVNCQAPDVVYDTRHPLPASGRTRPVVSAASVTATPSHHAGACPTTVVFTGVIQVSRVPARVTYQWIDSRTGASRPQVAVFRKGDRRVRTVRLAMPVTGSRTGWKAIHILSRNGHDSRRAAYSITCAPRTRVTVTAEVDRPVHSGTCPVDLTFTGRVTAARGTVVRYRWIDDKGGKGETLTLKASGRGGASVRPLVVKVGENAKGWRALEILAPERRVAKVPYTVTCAAPDYTKVDIDRLDPGDHTGPCADGVNYSATGRVTIPAGPARQVRWSWRLDDAEAGGGVLDFPASDRERTLDVPAWQATLNASGAHTLRLTAGDVTAERSFQLTCEQPDEVSISWVEVQPQEYAGPCLTPRQITANAVLGSRKAATIRYHWRVDGVDGEERTVEIPAGGGSKMVSTSWEVAQSREGTVALVVDSHTRPVSQPLNYRVACTTATIVNIAAAPASGSCPTSATITTTVGLEGAAGSVNIRWYAKADGESDWAPITGVQAVRFDEPGTKTVAASYASASPVTVAFKAVLPDYGVEKETGLLRLGCA